MTYGEDQLEDTGVRENRRDIGTSFIHSPPLSLASCRLNVGAYRDRSFQAS